MDAPKLTSEQIEELFVFCHKHYVPQYDLQIELVDHLAAAIEEQWENNPNLLFQDALNQSFGQFGIFGFSKIKDRKEKELQRKYNRLLFQFLLDFFRWPKILLTISLSILLFILFRLTSDVHLVTVGLTLAIALTLISYHFYLFDKYFSIRIYTYKSFMLLECLKNRQLMIVIAYQLPLIFSQFIHELNYNYINHPEIEFIIAFIFIVFSILLYLYFFVVPQKIKEHFIEQFPQFISS